MTASGVAAVPNALADTKVSASAERHPQEHRRAWEREMERAQMMSWLAHEPLKTAELAKPGVPNTRDEVGDRVGFGLESHRALRTSENDRETNHAVSGSSARMDHQARRLEPARQLIGPVQLAVAASELAQTESVNALGARAHLATGAYFALPHVDARLTQESTEIIVPTRTATASASNFATVAFGGVAQGALTALKSSMAAEDDAPRDTQVPVTLASKAYPSGSSSSESPIRLHTDWSVEGVRVWLALDANAQAHMNEVVGQVRNWMRSQGVKVLSFACNGRQVDEEANASVQPSHASPEIESLLQFQEKPLWLSAQ